MNIEQQSAVKEILYTSLSESSPDEAVLAEHCFDNPPKGAMDGMLGFGLGPECALALPVVLHLLKEFAESGAAVIVKEWGETLAHWLTSDRVAALDASVLDKFGRAIALRLEKQGFPSVDAGRISDSVVRTIIAKPDLLRALVRK